jgi:hypothetical protein
MLDRIPHRCFNIKSVEWRGNRLFVSRVAQALGVALGKVLEQRDAAANGFSAREVLQLEAALKVAPATDGSNRGYTNWMSTGTTIA